MHRTIPLVLAALTLAGAASAQELYGLRGPTPLPDAPTPPPLPHEINNDRRQARNWPEQPPVIPHSIENFSDINLEENACMDCHSAANFKKKNAPKIGDSHFVNRDGQKLDEASAARHNCVQCHVPQVDAPPLVESTFQGDQKPGAAPAKKAVKKN